LVTRTIPAVAWTILAVINWRFVPYALRGLNHSRGVSDWLRGPYWVSFD
jgi:hypothetical protein